jgi:GDPmannose 4,6-dehydratase
MAFEHVGLQWEKYGERYERPAEVDPLIGDCSKAKKDLGWEPGVRTPELVKIMVAADIKLLENERSGRLVRIDG